MEIGPYRVREDQKLAYNNGSWDEFANLLFVDQPVGTGFSYVNTDSYLQELDQMADQFMIFLEKWFALFPEYEHDDVSYMTQCICGKSRDLTGTRFTSPVNLMRASTSLILPAPFSIETKTHQNDLGI